MGGPCIRPLDINLQIALRCGNLRRSKIMFCLGLRHLAASCLSRTEIY